MAKTILPNGVVQPSIGSNEWGEDVNNNFKLLDDLIGEKQQSKVAYTELNNTFNGINTFNQPIIGSLQGVAEIAIKDAQGRVIDETYALNTGVVHISGNETISGLKTFINNPTVTRVDVGTTGYIIKLTFKRGSTISTTNHSTFRVVDADNIIVSEVCTENYSDGKVAQILNIRNTNDNGEQVQSGISHLLDKSGEQDWFYPTINGKTHLGTSSYKWATFNGLNPGALSFPSRYSSSMVVDTTGFDTDGGLNSYTPPVDGWLILRAKKSGFSSASLVDNTTAIGATMTSTDELALSSDFNVISIPVKANDNVSINIKRTSGSWFVILVPALGNV